MAHRPAPNIPEGTNIAVTLLGKGGDATPYGDSVPTYTLLEDDPWEEGC